MTNQNLLSGQVVSNVPRRWVVQRFLIGLLVILVVYAYSSDRTAMIFKKYSDTIQSPATTQVNAGVWGIETTPRSASPRIINATSKQSTEVASNKKLPTMLFMTRGTRDTSPKSRDPYLNDIINSHCPKKCDYTVDRKRLPTADGVFLQASEARKDGTPRRYSANQTFFLLLREPPGGVYYRNNFKYIPPYQINYTVGYVPGADIYSGYDELVPKGFDFFGRVQKNETDPFDDWNFVRERAMNKTKGGFAVISNCNSYSKRELYLKELQTRYPTIVNLFGKCYDKKRCDYDTCLAKNMLDYHFYFAFENIVCDNYVTEKFFRLKDLIVPIVLRKADYVRLVPEGSYIAVDQFASMEELAKYLEFLMNNKEEYLKYFEWTKVFQRESPSPIYRSLCKACQKLYEPNHKSSYNNLLEWYSMKNYCDLDFVPRLLKKHTQSG